MIINRTSTENKYSKVFLYQLKVLYLTIIKNETRMIDGIKTKKANREATALLKRQVRALKSVVKKGTGHEALLPIIEEKQFLLEYVVSNKTWNFNFEGGGWNSNQGVTREAAIQLAKKEYKGSKYTIVDPSSFRVATHSDTQRLLASFY